MPQRYKLRLGDGTVLAVDTDALRTWVHDPRAMAQAVGTHQWRPLQQILVEEEAAARLARALVPPQPKQATPPKPEEPAEPSPAPEPAFAPASSPAVAEPAFTPEPPVAAAPQPFAAAEPAFDLSDTAYAEPAAAPVDPSPFPTHAHWVDEPEAKPEEPEPFVTPGAVSPPFETPDWGQPAAPPPAPSSSFAPQPFMPEPIAPTPAPEPAPPLPAAPEPQLSALPEEPARPEEPVSTRYFEAAATPAIEDLPVIPLKPVEPRAREEPREVFRSAWNDEGDQTEEEDESRQATPLEQLGDLLSRLLTPLTPLADRILGRHDAALARGEERDEPDDSLPPPSEPEPGDFAPSLRERASAWLSGLRARFGSAGAGEGEDDEAEVEPVETVEPIEPPARAPATARARPAARPVEAPRELWPQPPAPVVPETVRQPPRPLSEIGVVPLAPSREPEGREDVYEDDEPGTPWSAALGPVWHWTRRLAVVGALAAAAWFGWTERAVWLPRAADLGQGLFGEIDRQVLSRKRGQEQQRALAAVSAQLPQLAPETIRVLFARNPMGVEEASEVFQVAREAADRGRASLPAAEAEELAAIEQQAFAALSRSERARVAEYDRTRARRAIFPFENPHVMELVARAARSLPPERRERLQQLTHGAVIAGLAQAPEAPAAASVDAPGSSR